jgi:hypothetical protein
VDTPTGLTKDQERMLREFAEARGEPISDEEHGIISRIRSSFG